jgi:hypothetical protein
LCLRNTEKIRIVVSCASSNTPRSKIIVCKRENYCSAVIPSAVLVDRKSIIDFQEYHPLRLLKSYLY